MVKQMSDTLQVKEAKLLQYIQQYKHPAVAFSGGVDSSVVLAACKAAGVQVQPIMALAAMIPKFERQDAIKVAQETSSELITLTVNPLANPQFCANDSKRCYYCKTMIMTAVKQQAQELGCDVVFDGTNADDIGDYRPGMQAIKEQGIVSPLLACGLTKADVRALAVKYNLSVANKPAYACLASRIAYGETITETNLAMVEQAEDYLRKYYLHDLRVRCHGNLARIEVNPKEITLIAAGFRTDILQKLQEIGFTYVTLDLNGYSTGSMNKILK